MAKKKVTAKIGSDSTKAVTTTPAVKSAGSPPTPKNAAMKQRGSGKTAAKKATGM